MIPPRLVPSLGLLLILLSTFPLTAGEPLSERIDQLVEVDQLGPLAGLASDAEFLRRATLDLHGAIPTSSEARGFLDDPSPNKRVALVDRLLSNPRFAVHMATVFDVMLMERRPDKHVTTVEWQKYLQTAFEKNTPYDQLAREILSADGVDVNLRPAAKFVLDRDAEPHVMSRDVGRIFFGMDLQCAQCHDHPLVDHYLQTDYFGLFAFVNRTVIFTDAAAKKSFLGEKADGDATYKSVFTQDAGLIRPQLPGENEIDEPRLRQGEDYIAAPLPNVRPVPKYSRRAKLAELATNGSNRQFNVNIANRLWAHMMGRGLVHPVDLHHPMNPPAHPAVLELVTNELVTMKYDMRRLLRDLALTRTYQRSIEPPTDVTSQLALIAQQLPVVTTELAALKSVANVSRDAVDTAQTEFKTARTALGAAETAWRTSEAAVTTAKKPVDDAIAAVGKSQVEAANKEAAISAVNEASAKSADVAKLLPNDKEIATAVATFAAKQLALASELAAVQKAVADQTIVQQAAQAKLVEAYVPADAAHAAYVEARQPVDAAKGRLIAVWNQHKADSFAMAIRKKRLDTGEAHLGFQMTLNAVTASQQAMGSQQTDLAAAIRAAEQQQLDVAKQSAAMADIEKLAAESVKLLETARADFAARQIAVKAVADAVAKTEAALLALPGDVELTQAIQKLKDRLEPLVKEAATLEQAVAIREGATKEVAATMATTSQMLTMAATELANRQQAVTAATTAVSQAAAAVQAAESSVVSGRGQLINLWTIDAGVRSLKQISPEQLAWATMQATGVLEPQRAAAEAEIEKTVPKASVATDAAQSMNREIKIEQHLHEQMRGNVAPFVGLYAASAGQPQDDFFATPDQALFVANGGTVIAWAAGGGLSQRLAPLTDSNAFADELYLSTLTRRPTEAETREAAQYLASRPTERPQATRELIWSLLTSAEFRFNH